MTLDFQYTYADYSEANRAHVLARNPRRAMLGWWLLAIALLAMVLLLPRRPYIRVPAAGPVLLSEMLREILPYLFVLVFIAFFITSRLGRPRQRYIDVAARTRRRFNAGGGLWIPFIVVGIVLAFLYQNGPPGALGVLPRNSVTFLVSFAPWIIFMAVVIFFATRVRRRQWNLQPALERPKHLEIDADRVDVVDQFFHSHYQWQAFLRCVESANLFMLYPSEVNFLMIPKRAMRPGEAERMREWVRAWANSFAAGFPVVPMAERVRVEAE